MLLAAHINLRVSGLLTAGDVVVGVGTLLLAVFTASLARSTSKLTSQTFALDQRTAARERKRRERQVRGVARLVYGELQIVRASIEGALSESTWWFWYEVPRGAWDRDGAVIVETVSQDVAFELIRTFSGIAMWQSRIAQYVSTHPASESLSFEQKSDESLVLVDLLPRVKDAVRHLEPVAYPDARDLEPDPDTEPPAPFQRRWWHWYRRPSSS